MAMIDEDLATMQTGSPMPITPASVLAPVHDDAGSVRPPAQRAPEDGDISRGRRERASREDHNLERKLSRPPSTPSAMDAQDVSTPRS